MESLFLICVAVYAITVIVFVAAEDRIRNDRVIGAMVLATIFICFCCVFGGFILLLR